MKKSLGLLLSLCFLIVAFSGFKNPPAKTAEHDISITNKTHYDIHHLYISPEHETHWGADELDHDHIVEHGHTVTVAVACGTWDVKIVDEKKQFLRIKNAVYSY